MTQISANNRISIMNTNEFDKDTAFVFARDEQNGNDTTQWLIYPIQTTRKNRVLWCWIL